MKGRISIHTHAVLFIASNQFLQACLFVAFERKLSYRIPSVSLCGHANYWSSPGWCIQAPSVVRKSNPVDKKFEDNEMKRTLNLVLYSFFSWEGFCYSAAECLCADSVFLSNNSIKALLSQRSQNTDTVGGKVTQPKAHNKYWYGLTDQVSSYQNIYCYSMRHRKSGLNTHRIQSVWCVRWQCEDTGLDFVSHVDITAGSSQKWFKNNLIFYK